MRDYGSATLATFQSRAALISRVLIWVEARNRLTNAGENMGLSTGADHETITIGGAPR